MPYPEDNDGILHDLVMDFVLHYDRSSNFARLISLNTLTYVRTVGQLFSRGDNCAKALASGSWIYVLKKVVQSDQITTR